MMGVLGNHNAIVKPWYLPGSWVFARVMVYPFWSYPKMKVIIVNNKIAPNMYGLPVDIIDRRVVSIRKGEKGSNENTPQG